MYTEDKAARIVLSLLKQYGIKKIVVSPGSTNVPISLTAQNDPWFEIYSVVDERSAAYFATGLSFETNEPVVISCTGATASRNYLSGMTEAYYRNLPIIALTSQHHTSDYRNLVPQVTDRRVSQNDVKKKSVMLPYIKDDEDREACEILVNDALISATAKGGGPVHINLLVDSRYPFDSNAILNEASRVHYYDADKIDETYTNLRKELKDKKIGIFIGSHKPFSKEEMSSISKFVGSYDVAVFTDHTSNYTGDNRVSTGQLLDMLVAYQPPDILIDIGSVSGDYSTVGIGKGVEVWRISTDGEIRKRFKDSKLSKLFECSEDRFFKKIVGNGSNRHGYYKSLSDSLSRIEYPELPLSNTYISGELAKRMPKNSSLHLSILNSLRNMNHYDLDKSIKVNSNVGGFGIDGPVSSLIGQSMSNKQKLFFGLVGDLAFFYDMNSLGIRHIEKNIRIILVNNNQGVEFRLNLTFETFIQEGVDSLVAAKGHNGSAKAWAESMGFEYLTANTKEEFNGKIEEFCSSDLEQFDKPVIFEVFTNVSDEQAGFDLIRMQNF